jgi:uncharacterized membrane protein YeaQ/YmgE (transglycosylase-associated protein family)
LAGVLVKGYGFRLIGNIVIGILGAGLAGILAQSLGLYTASTAGNIVAATVGALILAVSHRLGSPDLGRPLRRCIRELQSAYPNCSQPKALERRCTAENP